MPNAISWFAILQHEMLGDARLDIIIFTTPEKAYCRGPPHMGLRGYGGLRTGKRETEGP